MGKHTTGQYVHLTQPREYMWRRNEKTKGVLTYSTRTSMKEGSLEQPQITSLNPHTYERNDRPREQNHIRPARPQTPQTFSAQSSVLPTSTSTMTP